MAFGLVGLGFGMLMWSEPILLSMTIDVSASETGIGFVVLTLNNRNAYGVACIEAPESRISIDCKVEMLFVHSFESMFKLTIGLKYVL